MTRVSRGTPAGDAYLDLRNRARREQRPTQELLQLYVLEAFLARLVVSEARDRLVLKGGVLLAAFDSRRTTRDVDLAGLGLANEAGNVLALVKSLVSVTAADDGVDFLSDTASVEVIREEDEHSPEPRTFRDRMTITPWEQSDAQAAYVCRHRYEVR